MSRPAAPPKLARQSHRNPVRNVHLSASGAVVHKQHNRDLKKVRTEAVMDQDGHAHLRPVRNHFLHRVKKRPSPHPTGGLKARRGESP